MTGRARPGEASLSGSLPIQYKRVYLWHWATRSMHWVSVTCILVLAVTGTAVAADTRPKIAIIIDDLGYGLAAGRTALALPGAVTYSFLPHTPFAGPLAEQAHASGKEVMLHLPMEAVDRIPAGPGSLTTGMNEEVFARTLEANLASVPHVAGVNNHMGSLLTRHPGAMRWLMEDLSCFDRLYFVDSRTDVRTVARRQARALGLANAERDVFLDNLQDRDYIRGQLRHLIAEARRSGSEIGIGHPYPDTLAVLAEELPKLADQGIQLVPVSRLVERERNEGLWHASSSPLQKVAKNSKR